MHGVVIDFGIVNAHPLERIGLILQVAFEDGGDLEIFLQVRFGVAGDGIVRRMGSRETNLEKQGFGGGIVANPVAGHVADEVVGVHVFVELPLKGADALLVIRPLAVEFALLLDQSTGPKRLVPLVVKVAAFKVTVLVFDNIALIEAHGREEGPGVHFAEIDGLVSATLEIFNPAVFPAVGILQDTGGMRVVTGEEACPGRSAGCGGDEAVVEHDAFPM